MNKALNDFKLSEQRERKKLYFNKNLNEFNAKIKNTAEFKSVKWDDDDNIKPSYEDKLVKVLSIKDKKIKSTRLEAIKLINNNSIHKYIRERDEL